MEFEKEMEKWRVESYFECVDDMEIAKNEIIGMNIYPDSVIAELYCIPSHNHQAFYALVSRENNGYQMTYIKTCIYTAKYEYPIKMYPFVRCKQADNYPGTQGQFIMGIKKISKTSVDKLLQIIDVLPESYIFENEKSGIYIDGVLQGIRIFGNNAKEVFYNDAEKIKCLSQEQIEFLDSLFLEIEKTIES